MGGAIPVERGVLLPGTSKRFLAEPASLLQRSRADRCGSHGGTGYPDDHGLAEGSLQVAALLHVWEHVPRKSRCPCGAAGDPSLRTVPQGYTDRARFPVALSALRGAKC